MEKPILLLDKALGGFLTSRSLRITQVTAQGQPIEFMKDYLEIADHKCYGQYYMIPDMNNYTDFEICAGIGAEEYTYVF
jgi:hypothetical protein